MQSVDNVSTWPCIILFIILSLSGLPLLVNAQQAVPKTPVPVEFMAGNNRMFYQMVVARKFSPKSKFGILSVASFAAGYKNGMEELDLAVPAVVTRNVFKGFGLVGGLTVNNKTGAAPLIGGQHTFVNREWVLVTVASVFLNASKSIELFGLYEYKPSITPKLGLYNRIQFLYVHNTQKNNHARSFLQLRTGLKLNALNFGLGANLDQYGPGRTLKPNYGVFVGWAFQ